MILAKQKVINMSEKGPRDSHKYTVKKHLLMMVISCIDNLVIWLLGPLNVLTVTDLTIPNSNAQYLGLV